MIKGKILLYGKKEEDVVSLKIITKRCKGCGICATFCPKQVLAVSEIEKIEAVNEEACIKCGQCEMRCPDYAIFVEK